MADIPVQSPLETPPRTTGNAQQDFPQIIDWFWKAYLVINQAITYINTQITAIDGLINNSGEISLQPDSDTTVVSSAACKPTSLIILFPKTANAALEQTSGSLYVTSGEGEFTIYQTNNPLTDRTFSYVVISNAN